MHSITRKELHLYEYCIQDNGTVKFFGIFVSITNITVKTCSCK